VEELKLEFLVMEECRRTRKAARTRHFRRGVVGAPA
jgi:hypothetical protein